VSLQVVLRLFWFLPLAFGLRVILVWSNLPDPMAFRFTWGQPSGYLSRMTVLATGLAALAIGAVVTIRARHPVRAALSGGVTTFVFIGLWKAIDFNLGRGMVGVLPAAGIGAVVAIVIAGLAARETGTKRG
jgi:hypothetical protein